MFLGATCIDHGQAATSPSDVCCSGLTAWKYDANAGSSYGGGFMCWTAPCAAAGQFSNPGVGGPGCCSGLVSVGGKCAVPASGGGGSGGGGGTATCATIGHVPLVNQSCCAGLVKDATGICNALSQPASDQLIPGVDNMILYAVAGGLVLLMFMSKKKGA